MSLAFHAHPPAGQWLNDPNALIASGAGFQLLAQHRASPPEFRDTGWGLLTSSDLLSWRWSGTALHAQANAWCYSGSAVVVDGQVELFHTIHDPVSELQHQVRLGARDATLSSWRPLPAASLARPMRNVRDPFVFRHDGGWRMLLARPCDWSGWASEGASYLFVLASDDRAHWREAGRIGPWQPPGVMWEVPVLVQRGGRHLLLVSTVDRRSKGAACCVFGWSGQFDGATFRPDELAGKPVDLGPDCYALMVGAGNAWPNEPPFVAWLSSWETARAPVWPGFSGGPISLPRSVDLDANGVPTNRSWIDEGAFGAPVGSKPPAGVARAWLNGTEVFELHLLTDRARLMVIGNPAKGELLVIREAAAPFAWQRRHAKVLAPCEARALSVFIDGPATEIFVEPEGRAVSVALPGRLLDVSLQAGGVSVPLEWCQYAPPAGRLEGRS